MTTTIRSSRRSALAAALTSLALGVSLLGCGEAEVPGGSTPTTEAPAIDQTYAGLTVADEAPQFGEEAAFEEIGAAEADEPMADPTIAPAEEEEARQQGRLYVVALAWGHLKNGPLAAAPLAGAGEDFSGSIAISDGAIAVIRRVRMERRQDDGVLPRTDRQRVEWTSTIYNHHDGLLLKVLVREGATVTITVAGQTISRRVGELDLAAGRVDVPGTTGELGFAAAGVATQGRCERGLMVGRWHTVADVQGAAAGGFRGRWMSIDGELRGHLRGVFGQRQDGTKAAFGKYIGNGGQFGGLLAGRYGDGAYQGVALDRDLGIQARFHGLTFEQPGPARTDAGFFLGTWRASCDAEPLAADGSEVK